MLKIILFIFIVVMTYRVVFRIGYIKCLRDTDNILKKRVPNTEAWGTYLRKYFKNK